MNIFMHINSQHWFSRALREHSPVKRLGGDMGEGRADAQVLSQSVSRLVVGKRRTGFVSSIYFIISPFFEEFSMKTVS